MLTWSRALTHVAACYGDDRPAPLALMAACPAARAAVEYSVAGAVMACDDVVVRRRRRASVPDAPVYMQSHTCELTVDRWDRHSTAAVTAASWWLLRAPPADAASAATLQPRLTLCVRAMHDGDALPRAADDDDGPARPLDARVRGVRVQTRWRDVYARLCAVRVPHSDGGVDVSALRDTAAQLTVLQLCGTAATAALDWLPQCAQLQELTLQCNEWCANVSSRSIDLSALTQLRTCTLFIDGIICVDLRGCRALRDVHVCRYCISCDGDSSVDACTTLMLYRTSGDDVLRELATTAYVTINSFYCSPVCHQHFLDDDYYAHIPERSVLVHTSVACDLHWLARCTQLETVCIRHTRQDEQHNGDYSALAALPRLRKLDFRVPCVDLRTLAQCTQLEELALHEGCYIGDFSVLASAPRLRKVSLVKRTEALLRSLQHCTQLEELSLCDCIYYMLYDVEQMLANLPHLRKVTLRGVNDNVVRMIAKCKHTEVLDLKELNDNYSWLAALPRLREVTVRDAAMHCSDWIEKCTSLEKLDFQSIHLRVAYKVPHGLPKLRELSISLADDSDIRYVALSTQLVKLRLYHCNVDCRPLRALTQLRELYIEWAKIRNVNELAHCTQLVTLNLTCHRDARCEHVHEPLPQEFWSQKQYYARHLRYVYDRVRQQTKCRQCRAKFTDYSRLGALTQLRVLTLYGEGTLDVSWIVHCTQLEVLDLQYINVVPRNKLCTLPRLRVLTLCWVTRASLGWLVRCTQLEQITLCKYNEYTRLASLAQLRELGLCDIGEAKIEAHFEVVLRRNKPQTSATHSGTAPVHYKFTYTAR